MKNCISGNTEILDDEFVDEINKSSVIKSKISVNSIFKSFKYFILFLIIGFIVFKSVDMIRYSASISNMSLNIVSDDLYVYEKVEFADLDLSVLENIRDFDNDDISNIDDILVGVRNFISKKPVYKSEYYDGGYAPDGV